MDYLKLKSFHTAKKTCNIWKSKLQIRRKYFVNHVSEKLASKLYKEVIHSLAKKQTIQLKMGKGRDVFPKRTYKWPIGIHKKVFNVTNHQGNAN